MHMRYQLMLKTVKCSQMTRGKMNGDRTARCRPRTLCASPSLYVTPWEGGGTCPTSRPCRATHADAWAAERSLSAGERMSKANVSSGCCPS